jgi:hypothetical protein
MLQISILLKVLHFVLSVSVSLVAVMWVLPH